MCTVPVPGKKASPGRFPFKEVKLCGEELRDPQLGVVGDSQGVQRMEILPCEGGQAYNGVHGPPKSAALLDHEAMESKADSVGSAIGGV